MSNATFARWLPRLASLGALAIIAGLFVGGAQPVAVGLIPAPWDKLVHAGVFSVLTLLLWQAFGGRLLWAISAAVLLGGLDELHQSFLPGRAMGLDDWLADAAGASLAFFFVTLWHMGMGNKK